MSSTLYYKVHLKSRTIKPHVASPSIPSLPRRSSPFRRLRRLNPILLHIRREFRTTAPRSPVPDVSIRPHNKHFSLHAQQPPSLIIQLRTDNRDHFRAL